jgi:hypothetical protein
VITSRRLDGPTGVDQNERCREIDRVQQRRVLDDECVGINDRLAGADLAVVDAAEGHHRRARALGPEEREGLSVEAIAEGGDGQELGGGHDPLAAPAVKANLVHT